MTVTFADKLARIPNYEAGTSLEDATARAETADAIKLASNESPFPPHPAVIEAITRAAARAQPLPGSRGASAPPRDRRPPRDRPGADRRLQRLLRDPARGRLALCEPGDEILYAWPSFSIYPVPGRHFVGAREIRVPLAEGYVHDLDAMLEEVTAATQLLIVCNPNNPTGTHLPADRDRRLH